VLGNKKPVRNSQFEHANVKGAVGLEDLLCNWANIESDERWETNHREENST
jgi:hypothetical protein